MATLYKVQNKSGDTYTIQEVVNGVRRKITLGKMSKKSAETIISRVETINTCNLAGLQFPADVAQWLGTIGDDLYEKLSKAGLVQARQAVFLADQMERFIKTYSGGKEPETLIRWKIDRDRIFGFFGKNKSIKDVKRSDCERYKSWLYNERHMADSTVGRAIRNARMFFAAWVRDGLIIRNPFDGVKGSNAIDESRNHYFYCID